MFYNDAKMNSHHLYNHLLPNQGTIQGFMTFWSSVIRNEEKYLQFFSPSLEEIITSKFIVLERVVLMHCSERKTAESTITMI